MIEITRQQVFNRYESLPETLREAGSSESNIGIFRDICQRYHLTDDKRMAISKIIGYVILGFIHPEDLPREIKDMLDIDINIANAVYEEVSRKIFTPIRADLEKVYASVVGAEESAGLTAVPPEHIIDLKPKTEVPTPQMPEMPPAPVSVAEIPKAVSLEEKKEELPQEEEGPVIIHKEIEQPTAATPERKSLGGLLGFLTREKKEEIKPTTAQVKLGGEALPQAALTIAKAESAKPRIVHYTEFRTPVSPFEGTAPVPEVKPQASEEKAPVVPEIKPAEKELPAPEAKPMPPTPEPIKPAIEPVAPSFVPTAPSPVSPPPPPPPPPPPLTKIPLSKIAEIVPKIEKIEETKELPISIPPTPTPVPTPPSMPEEKPKAPILESRSPAEDSGKKPGGEEIIDLRTFESKYYYAVSNSTIH